MQLNSYSKDTQGAYVAANAEFISFTHLNHIDELLGKTDQEMPWADTAPLIMSNDTHVMKTGVSHVFIEQAFIKGKQHIRRCFKSPLMGSGGRILGVVGMSVAVEPSILTPLSPQQTDCLKELAMGFGIKKIGKNLGLSPRTVEHYLNNLKIKLGCKSRSELIVQAVMRGLYRDFTV